METEFNIRGRWPELFAPLSERQQRVVVNAFASSWHEGWVPNRPDVENLTDLVRGAITEAEYDRRGVALIEAGRAERARSNT